MPSPFPGMDPYLEAPALWPDVHQSLITYIRDDLQPYVRPKYHARIGERLYVVEVPHTIYPGVTLVRRPIHEPAPVDVGDQTVASAPVGADVPFTLAVPPVEYREPFVEIVHTAGGEVITVIEVLSSANKTPGEGHRLYRQKQQEILRSRTHLVEIDLLSQGVPTIALPEASFTSLPPWRYLVSVSRAPHRHQFEVYPVSLAARLPRFRVPLKEGDPDVVLDLQAVFSRCYDNGGYADFLDYSQASPVPLSPEEGAWVDQMWQERRK
jgi:hypothetical protein